MKVVSRLLATVVAGLALGAVVPSQAALTLTPVGIAKGFTLSLFVDQVPNTGFCCGPLGIATNNIGQIVVQDWANKTNNVFLDVDNQHFSAKLSSAAFGASSYGSALTNSGGTLYATQNDVGKVFTLNPDGSVNAPLTAAGAGGHGIWTNPITGHLAAATGSAINDINPTTGAFTPIVSNIDVDGVSVAADGSVVYGATGGHVFGWNYTTGALVYDSGGIGSPES